jgi:hypothetical protein
MHKVAELLATFAAFAFPIRDAYAQPGFRLRAEQRRPRLPRRGPVWMALVAAIGGMTLVSAAPGDADGGCSPATATVIAAGVTQTSDGTACSGGPQYWAMSLEDRDTLTLSGVPGPPAGELSLDVYGPDVQTIGQPLCSGDDNFGPFSVGCVIPATGQYLIVANGSGSFTPTITSKPGAPQPVAGTCDSVSAASVASDVTQYANSQVCQPSGNLQYWTMSVPIGDTLKLSGIPGPPGGELSLDVYGPNVQTIGQPLCSADDNFGPFSADCVIPSTGRYLIVATGSGSFTPVVVDPLITALRRAVDRWGRSHRRSTISVRASAPRALTVCLIIVSGWRTGPSLDSLSCGSRVGPLVIATGRHAFSSAGSAQVKIRLTKRAKHRLAGHRRKLTLITIYSVRGQVAGRTSIRMTL